MVKKNSTRFWLCLLLYLSVFLTACGAGISNSKSDNNVSGRGNSSNAAKEREWVYVPERIVIQDEKADYDEMNLIGDTVCYVSMNGESSDEVKGICHYSLSSRELTQAPIEWPMEGSHRDVVTYAFNPDLSVWLIVNVYPADFSKMSRFLCKFDAEGKSSFSQDVTEQLGSGISMDHMALDGQGRIYIFSNEYSDQPGIWLYAADGSYYGMVSYGSWENVLVRGAVCGEDGKVYACISKGENAEYCTLIEVDFEKKQFTEVIADFPNVDGFSMETNLKDFLLYDKNYAYGYNGQTAEELFLWMDSNINGYFVTDLQLLDDGRYYAVVEDWAGEDRSIVLLTKTRAEDAPKRQDLVLATVKEEGEYDDLVGLAMHFNRENYPYHVTVKNYGSLTDLYNAMLTKEPMDIIDLSGVDAKKLSRQGILEDLNPYVEQSSAFGRADFVEGLLSIYEFDGILAGIPETFHIRTVVGDGAAFGKGGGLTLDEMLKAVSAHPKTMPFDGVTKDEMMQYIMMFNEDTFIDWDTGECYFESDTFKAVLELCSRLPDEDADNRAGSDESDKVPLSDKIQDGEVLFAMADIWGFKSLQPYVGIWGKTAACIGFPTKEGSGGTLVFPYNAFGIATVSECKEGAWKFVECVLTREQNNLHMYSINSGYFPVMKEDMDRIVEEDMQSDAERLKRGRGLGEYHWSKDLVVPYHATTWEEVNDMLALVSDAVPFYETADDEIIKIIGEEAQAYYKGQKSADAVAKVIQNRVHLYVGENQ
ncbi:MAG: extracellular solute-binding protein [Bacteroidales bacterium]|nr:extracellular solute-binding protein [Lachnoclostridium sp.]MCM1384305.1 extracellular solute-binding protein [Lachnoclostridium sp.]MCM1464886.1 extracellular solute-binding protein [Bacteroidales bacterium]